MSWQCYIPAVGVPSGVRVMGGSRENHLIQSQMKIEAKPSSGGRGGSLTADLIPRTEGVSGGKRVFNRNESAMSGAGLFPTVPAAPSRAPSRITQCSLPPSGGSLERPRPRPGTLRPMDCLTTGLHDRRCDALAPRRSSQPLASLGADLVPRGEPEAEIFPPLKPPQPFRRIYGLN